MKKTIATTLAALLIAGISAGAAEPAAAAYFPPHPPIMIKHPKHWHEHFVCVTHWRHGHKTKVCFWVPNRH